MDHWSAMFCCHEINVSISFISLLAHANGLKTTEQCRNRMPSSCKPEWSFLLVVGVPQKALGVCSQLRVPPVRAVSEAGQLPAPRGSERLRGGLRGELRPWPGVSCSEEVLLQQLWPHLPEPKRPLQRWAKSKASLLGQDCHTLYNWVMHLRTNDWLRGIFLWKSKN